MNHISCFKNGRYVIKPRSALNGDGGRYANGSTSYAISRVSMPVFFSPPMHSLLKCGTPEARKYNDLDFFFHDDPDYQEHVQSAPYTVLNQKISRMCGQFPNPIRFVGVRFSRQQRKRTPGLTRKTRSKSSWVFRNNCLLIRKMIASVSGNRRLNDLY